MKKVKKKTCLLFIGLFVHCIGFAQMPYVDTAWVRASPVVGPGIYHTSTIVSSGKLVVTGNVVNISGDTDIITTKYNTNGTVNWSMTYSGNFTGGGDDYGVELKEQGSYTWVIGAVKNNTTGYDWIVLKYLSSNGTLSASYSFNGTGNGDDIPTALLVESSAVYVCGGSQATNGLSDYAVVKWIYSGPGSGWTKYYDYNNLHDGATAIVSSGTNVTVTGGSAATIGDWDIATLTIHKLAGTMTSSRTNITGATIVEARAMATDSLNNIYVTGYALVGGDKDIQTFKLDSNLALKWITGYEDVDDDAGNDIAVDSDGNVYITGYNEQPDGRFKAITIKYDDNGDTLWTEKAGDTETGLGAKAQKIAVNADDEVFITGVNLATGISSSFFFSQYSEDGAILLTAKHESDAVDTEAYDIVIDSDTVYVTGLSNPLTPTMTSIKYVLLKDVDFHYYYVDGKKSYWCQQPGMYSFSTTDSLEIVGYVDSTLVIGLEYTADGFHDVFFSPFATEAEIDSIIDLIEAEPNFDKEFLVGLRTVNIDHPYSDQLYGGLDNYITVAFDDPYIALVDVEDFADDYNLTLIHDPSDFVDGGVYIFQVPRNSDPTLTMDIAAEIWEQDSAIVLLASPSLRIFRLTNPDDPEYGTMWYAENDGTGTCNGGGMSNDADIELDKAWNLNDEFSLGESWSGQGIKVGVLDFHAFQYDHPDLIGVFETGYHTPGLAPFTSTVVNVTNQAHGNCVSGIIAANLDNSEGMAGVAYNSTIVPILMASGSTANVVAGIQKLCDPLLGVSIINMSFAANTILLGASELADYKVALDNAADQGRGGLGMIMVASAGNVDAQVFNYPAIHPGVLGVGATNPLDQKKTNGDGYHPTSAWGSSWSPYLDVCAPGTCIIATDYLETTGYGGYVTGAYYYSFDRTSASAPMASGVAALMLEKDPTLTAEELYQGMRFGCEKVGGYTYNVAGPTGKCTELGYGRLNAYESLQLVPLLGVEESPVFTFYFNNPANDLLQLTVPDLTSYSVVIVTVTGEVCYQTISSEAYNELNLSNLAEGLYFITITDQQTQQAYTSKLVIQ